MATSIFEDLVIAEGQVRTYTQNSDFGHVGALEFAPSDPSGFLQPSLINYGEMRFLPDATLYATQFFIRFATHAFWENSQIRNFGTISAVIPTADYVKALFASSWSPDLWNAGSILVQAKEQAIAYESWDASLRIQNTATGTISSAGNSAFGLYLANGGTITNAGTIVATAQSRDAFAIALPNGKGVVFNSGLIQATDDSPGAYAVAIGFYGSSDGATFVNSGTIRGEYAYRENNPYGYDSRTVVRNTGLIEGITSLAHGNDKVFNAGRIVGDIDLGAGADFYLGRTGTIVGTVLGGEGNDLLIGGAGRDKLSGGAGADALFASGGDTLTGGSGSDVFIFTAVTPGASADAITDFASGIDRIDLRVLAPSSVTINGSTISAITAAGTLTIQVSGAVVRADILTDPATATTGTAGDDVLVAGPQGSTLAGGDGADLLVGGAGNDRLVGGNGSRDAKGNDYGDLMVGGAGDDTYVVNEQQDDVVEEVDGGYDTVEIDPAQWGQFMYFLPDNIERLIAGGTGGNAFGGNALDNMMVGTAGSDRIEGRDGNDTLEGGVGEDALYGGAGADILDGGAGDDMLDGGGGIDAAIYSGNRASYLVTKEGQSYRVFDQRGGANDGSDLLTNVELLQFADGTIPIGQALPNTAPTAGADSALTMAGTSVVIAVLANDTDANGDALSIAKAGDPPHGTAAINAGGTITYSPDAGFTGKDSFTYTIADDRSGSATQTVTVTVLPAANDFRLFAGDGFVGQIGGAGAVFGTAGAQDITVLGDAGSITFDPSFNRGGDIVRLTGDAADWDVARSGSSAIFADGDAFVQIPVGGVGAVIVFDDGARTLKVDAGGIRIGEQTITTAFTELAAVSQGDAAPVATNPAIAARLFLASGGDVSIGGRVEVFGTAGAENVSVLPGNIVLDPSFNRGGDSIGLAREAGDFTARLVGSKLILDSADTDISIPIGDVGISLVFAGGDARTLVVAGSVMLGDQVITGTPVVLSDFA